MKRIRVFAGVCLVVLAIAAISIAVGCTPSETARRAWQADAIAEITAHVTDSTWLSNELARLTSRGTNVPMESDGWLSEHLIVMKNGDWLAYTNNCEKENRRIGDLFLGRASDGRWYYSTYHFCIGMIVLKMEDQAEDLSAFSAMYHLRQFDEGSSEPLQKTWPPESR